MKTCNKCKVEKTLELFYTDPTKKDGHSYTCKECRKAAMRDRSKDPALVKIANERSKAWYAANRERAKKKASLSYNPESNLTRALRRYGMSQYEYDLLMLAQEGKCAICKAKSGNRKGDRLVIYHCHSSGEVRGLLCHSCNRGLGMFKDQIDLVKSAMTYLGETQNV